MAKTTSFAQNLSQLLPQFLWRRLPGVLLLFGLGYLGKLLEQFIKDYGKAHDLTLPDIEYVLWAILFGTIIVNTVGIPKIFRPGVATYEFWLRVGIALLGARFLLGDILKLGAVSLVLVAFELCLAIAITMGLGRFFGIGPKLASLLAIGSSICGVSAIVAGKGAIESEDDEAAFAIAIILALGAVGLLVYPAIGHFCDLEAPLFGLWTGLVVENTATTATVSALYSEGATQIAMLVKTARNAAIGFVVLGFTLFWARRGQASNIENKRSFLWQKFPKFVLAFLLISLLGTFGAFSKEQLVSLGNLSRWAFLLAFAGVGLNINLRSLRQLGVGPVMTAVMAKLIVSYAMLTLVVLMNYLGLVNLILPK
ncbi:putative membrane protein [Pleurocapsa sp. PCC 7327]|uniref:YeiH family protein n=1 Tax=Pleurocapsa sp. PCC 7327 TaxID=118163 RepID=UPI00029FB663|nr:putative sulfate exporter family transporter [Pleurocapsa sp. PCC 7327]AFY76734.1 putative membrane protein [Pleurocapsa sp. PCC 7327]